MTCVETIYFTNEGCHIYISLSWI